MQTRGTGIKTEIKTADLKDEAYLGSNYEIIEEAHIDITAWVSKLKSMGYEKFVLIGHSYGTHKVVRYLFEGELRSDIEKIILLAPFDKNGYIQRHTNGRIEEYLRIAESELDKRGEGDLVPYEYDDFQMSYQTFISWYKDTDLDNIWDFYRKGYRNPTLNQIKIPVQVIYGDSDDDVFMPEYNEIGDVEVYIKSNIEDVEVNVLQGCGHTFNGFEKEVSGLVKSFCKDD